MGSDSRSFWPNLGQTSIILKPMKIEPSNLVHGCFFLFPLCSLQFPLCPQNLGSIGVVVQVPLLDITRFKSLSSKLVKIVTWNKCRIFKFEIMLFFTICFVFPKFRIRGHHIQSPAGNVVKLWTDLWGFTNPLTSTCSFYTRLSILQQTRGVIKGL